MPQENKHGLSRTIPETVKRKIRKNSGFGCVLCGCAICEYEHVDPEWHEALTHNPNKMTLLCGSCHSKKTRGIYSADLIKEAMRNPVCKTKGFSFDYLDFGRQKPIVQLGKTTFDNPLSLISINGVSYFSIIPPDPQFRGEPYKISALFSDNDENSIIGIKDNIWYGNAKNWDVETKGRQIIVRKKKGEISLKIENIPGDRFIIHKLDMNINGYLIHSDNSGMKIKTTSNKEILTLCGEGSIRGKIAINIINEQVIFDRLIVNGGEMDWHGGGIITNCTFVNGKITI